MDVRCGSEISGSDRCSSLRADLSKLVEEKTNRVVLRMNRIVAFIALLCCALPASAAETPLFKGSESIPADAVILFNGKDLANWTYLDGRPADWKVADGYMEVRGGNIRTKQEFGDCQIHIEFWLPRMDQASGQGRANSGVYVQGSYEIQILDSYGFGKESGDCGGIYGIAAPLVNACRPPEHWQSYDILFRAPRYDDKGNKVANARLTVLHNGVLIHENVELPNATAAGIQRDLAKPGPLMLQDHGNPVRFRNIWIRPLAS